MRIYIGADHAGFEQKEHLKRFLDAHGHVVVDCGPIAYEKTDDYPDIAHIVVQKVSEDEGTAGILICDSGIGMSIVANRYRDIRAALAQSVTAAQHARADNDANVLCLGAMSVAQADTEKIALTFLETDFSGEQRHIRRIGKINR